MERKTTVETRKTEERNKLLEGIKYRVEIHMLKDLIKDLWGNIKNGTIDDNFFELKTRVHNSLTMGDFHIQKKRRQ